MFTLSTRTFDFFFSTLCEKGRDLMHRCTLISLGSVCVFLVRKDKRLQIECELMKGYSFPLHLTNLMVYEKNTTVLCMSKVL